MSVGFAEGKEHDFVAGTFIADLCDLEGKSHGFLSHLGLSSMLSALIV